ncbi:MAG: AbrB/MazE/SpoVT family DNA-binding domain-containing protein [Pseudomonadota bacterium]
MLAKLTSKNQITIPKKIMAQLPDVTYFDLEYREGAVIMKPAAVYETNLEQIRAKVKQLGLTPDSVCEAVAWARKK